MPRLGRIRASRTAPTEPGCRVPKQLPQVARSGCAFDVRNRAVKVVATCVEILSEDRLVSRLEGSHAHEQLVDAVGLGSSRAEVLNITPIVG